MIDDLVENSDITKEEAKEIVLEYMLNTFDNDRRKTAVICVAIALASIVLIMASIYTIIVFLNPKKGKVARQILKRENGEELYNRINKELEIKNYTWVEANIATSTFATENYIFISGTFNMDLIIQDDLVWIYKLLGTSNGVQVVTKTLVLNCKNGKSINVLFKSQEHIDLAINKIVERRSEICLGYYQEFIEIWKKDKHNFLKRAKELFNNNEEQ